MKTNEPIKNEVKTGAKKNLNDFLAFFLIDKMSPEIDETINSNNNPLSTNLPVTLIPIVKPIMNNKIRIMNVVKFKIKRYFSLLSI
jgi:hypothetical protein